MSDTRSSPHIIFVHGTWARGIFPNLSNSKKVRWFDAGSRFRETLTKMVGSQPFVMVPFIWSGANSIVARKNASADLARLIDAEVAGGVTDLTLVGHSHGGNVIIDAIPLMKQRCPNVTVVSLATPFVSFDDANQSLAEAVLFYFGYFVTIAVASMFVLGPLQADQFVIVVWFAF